MLRRGRNVNARQQNISTNASPGLRFEAATTPDFKSPVIISQHLQAAFPKPRRFDVLQWEASLTLFGNTNDFAITESLYQPTLTPNGYKGKTYSLQIRYGLNRNAVRLAFINRIIKQGNDKETIVFGLAFIDRSQPTIQETIRKLDRAHSTSLRNLTTLGQYRSKIKGCKYIRITVSDCGREPDSGNARPSADHVVSMLNGLFMKARDADTLAARFHNLQVRQIQSQRPESVDVTGSTQHSQVHWTISKQPESVQTLTSAEQPEPEVKPVEASTKPDSLNLGTSAAPLPPLIKFEQQLIETVDTIDTTPTTRSTGLTLSANFSSLPTLTQLSHLGTILDAFIPTSAHSSPSSRLSIISATDPAPFDPNHTRIVSGVLLRHCDGQPVPEVIKDAMELYMDALWQARCVKRFDQAAWERWTDKEVRWHHRLSFVVDGGPMVAQEGEETVIMLQRWEDGWEGIFGGV
ncbi:hypothetical protein H2198_007403 [Neophaeococcomyces mojaviensis]|uniref:Uncharacterized protein n=1 Tax=Neophaeococcomyces mojaviensis TaxID=3383035 RepID=A0ACC3A0B6_9EURO|nr:hypothetical protein H2198_007403 [Knufia sp. JES_112]